MIQKFTDLFPLWAVCFSAMALVYPGFFAGGTPLIVPLLGVVMFGMGATLTWDDFSPIVKKPGQVALGMALQYGLMPLAGWLIALALDLPPQVAAGIIVVGACPGGTASNVVAYLAKGNVALSITITFCSTLVAVALTPALTWLYAGAWVDVPMAAMTWSVFKIVILPVTAGVAANTIWSGRIGKVRLFFPALSVACIVIIISIIVGLNAGKLANIALAVIVAVAAHNALGLAAGYWISKALGLDAKTCRTLAIEVGMQNSGLGVALALKYFGATAALPGAFFSIWHNLSGALLASYWARKE